MRWNPQKAKTWPYKECQKSSYPSMFRCSLTYHIYTAHMFNTIHTWGRVDIRPIPSNEVAESVSILVWSWLKPVGHHGWFVHIILNTIVWSWLLCLTAFIFSKHVSYFFLQQMIQHFWVLLFSVSPWSIFRWFLHFDLTSSVSLLIWR